MASILRKPSKGGQFKSANLSTRKGALHQGVPIPRRNTPWDKVYSEIAERLRPSSTVQQHVRDHVGDFVNLYRAPDRRYGMRLDAPWWQPLYVDALCILRRTADLDRKARRRAASRPKAAPPLTIVRLPGDEDGCRRGCYTLHRPRRRYVVP